MSCTCTMLVYKLNTQVCLPAPKAPKLHLCTKGPTYVRTYTANFLLAQQKIIFTSHKPTGWPVLACTPELCASLGERGLNKNKTTNKSYNYTNKVTQALSPQSPLQATHCAHPFLIYLQVTHCATNADLFPPHAEAWSGLGRGPLQDLWQHTDNSLST